MTFTGNHTTGGWQLDRIDPRSVADLRRRHARELTEAVLSGSKYLDEQDRALLEAVYERGIPASHLARLRDEPARTVRRRVRKLAERIASPAFNFVLLHKDAWTPTRRRVAERCVLGGVSMRAAAEQLGTSLHNVRKEMNAINALIDLHEQQAALNRPHDPPGKPTRRPSPPSATGGSKGPNSVNEPARHAFRRGHAAGESAARSAGTAGDFARRFGGSTGSDGAYS